MDQDLQQRRTSAHPAAGTRDRNSRLPTRVRCGRLKINQRCEGVRINRVGAENVIHALLPAVVDKPGRGASTGDWTRLTLHDRAAETLAAVADQPEIDANRIALLGGSQGGWVAPFAASRYNAVKAVVVISGPGVTVAESEEFQIRAEGTHDGYPPDEVAQALGLFRRVLLLRGAASADPRRARPGGLGPAGRPRAGRAAPGRLPPTSRARALAAVARSAAAGQRLRCARGSARDRRRHSFGPRRRQSELAPPDAAGA